MNKVVGDKIKKINIEDAIGAADNCIKKLTDLMENEIKDVRLEEFGLNGNNWKITLSYVVENKNYSTVISSIYNSNYERIYKSFTIDSNNGEVIRMEDKKTS